MSKSSGKKRKQARLGELLLDTGLIAPHQLSVALGQQAKWGGKLGSELIRLGFIGETELAYILEKQLGIKWISLKDQVISTEVIQSVSHETARKYHIMPVACSHQMVTIAMVNPNDLDTLDALAFAIGKAIKPVMALESDIEWALSHYYDSAKRGKARSDTSVKTKTGSTEVLDDRARDVLSFKRLKMRSPEAQETLIRLLIKKGVFSWDEFVDESEESS